MDKSEQRLVFCERLIEGAAGFAVPGALSAFAVEVLGTCRIPFEQADRGVMLLLDRAKEHVIVVGEFGVYGTKVVGCILSAEAGPVGAAARERRPLAVCDDGVGQSSRDLSPVEAALWAEQVALAPLADDSGCIGVLGLLGGSDATFSEADLSRLARKGKYSCRELRLLLGKDDVSAWYDDMSERLAPSSLTEQDMHVLLQAFGHDFKTGNAELAQVLTADVGEALKGVGLRAGEHTIGGAKRYTTEQVQTLLKAFGVEITIGRGEVCDLLTMDVLELVRGPDDSGNGDKRQEGA